MAKCILCKKEVSWFTICYDKYCPKCWEKRQKEIQNIEKSKEETDDRKASKIEKTNVEDSESSGMSARIFWGVGLILIGVFASVISYSTASPGSSYFLWFGPIIWGIAVLFSSQKK